MIYELLLIKYVLKYYITANDNRVNEDNHVYRIKNIRKVFSKNELSYKSALGTNPLS